MKRNDVGDFIVLYVEPGDQRADLFQTIGMQKKPVVLIPAGQTGVLQRPDDFTLLKYVKRQIDLPVIFILPHGTQQAQMAARNGFPVYPSTDALLNVLNIGQMAHMHTAHSSGPSRSPDTANITKKGTSPSSTAYNPRITKHLFPDEDSQEDGSHRISPQFTPIPQLLMPEEDAEQHPLFPSPQGDRDLRTADPLWSASPHDAKDHIHIADRNTGPLDSGQGVKAGHAPQTPPIVQKEGRGLIEALLCLLVIVAISSFLILPHFLNGAAPTPQINGHLVFTSSGQVSETSSQGIEDQVTLDLTNLAVPTNSKALYVWLLGDQSANDPQTILLGKLQVHNGTAHLFYPGNTQHTNILLTMSQILVTEEDTAFAPIAPSPDQTAWRYSGEFSTTPIDAPDNTNHFSFLDHLRHLLAADPALEEIELPGGLNNWLYNNTSKVKEWVDSTRQQWEETKDTNFVRRQLERALQFMDGDTFVYQDMPQEAPLLVNERLARVGLINITGPNQEPPDYLDHISHHLNGLLEAKPTPAIRQKIADLTTALGNVSQWLTQVRHDAQQLMMMTDSQMMQQSTLAVIDDMIANMDNAYSGQPDPSNNTVHEGVDWIHNQMQFLATLDIAPWKGANTNNLPGQNNSNLSQTRFLISEEKSAKR